MAAPEKRIHGYDDLTVFFDLFIEICDEFFLIVGDELLLAFEYGLHLVDDIRGIVIMPAV